jgi:hypothetical protein
LQSGKGNVPDARRLKRGPDYVTNRISEYVGSGHRSSATNFSSRSATLADAVHRRDELAHVTVTRIWSQRCG